MVVGVSWSGVSICWRGLTERGGQQQVDVTPLTTSGAAIRELDDRQPARMAGADFQLSTFDGVADSIRLGDNPVDP
jgi:hypothetical protein